MTGGAERVMEPYGALLIFQAYRELPSTKMSRQKPR
jgi:hypothetical protein